MLESIEPGGELGEVAVKATNGVIDGGHPSAEKLIDALGDLGIDLRGDPGLDLLDHRSDQLAQEATQVTVRALVVVAGLVRHLLNATAVVVRRTHGRQATPASNCRVFHGAPHELSRAAAPWASAHSWVGFELTKKAMNPLMFAPSTPGSR